MTPLASPPVRAKRSRPSSTPRKETERLPGPPPAPRTEAEKPLGPPRTVYGRPFWLTYISNSMTMAVIALLFRYADFIAWLGGTEFHLGWIVGVGVIGSLAMRVILGSCIDRYGTRIVWRGSTLLLAAVCFAHLAVASHAGPTVYLLRILYCCAIAGVYGASMTFISGRGPTERMAELIGMLGTAGFLGTVAGTMLGDFLFGAVAIDRAQVSTMFVAAGVLTLCSFPFVWFASRAEVRPKPLPGTSLIGVLRRHQPGAVLIVGIAMGMGLGLPGVFLRPYAAALDIPRIGLFFTVYAVAAIITRIVTRRWSERFGVRPLILLGAAGTAASIAMLLLVHTEWQLIWPAIAFGCSHAMLFPSVVAAGSVAFPARHRGLATILVLAAFDVGLLVGAPTAGAMLRISRLTGLPPYPTMFSTMAGLLALVAAWYAVVSRERAPKI